VVRQRPAGFLEVRHDVVAPPLAGAARLAGEEMIVRPEDTLRAAGTN
jgi:hypothetical protein